MDGLFEQIAEEETLTLTLTLALALTLTLTLTQTPRPGQRAVAPARRHSQHAGAPGVHRLPNPEEHEEGEEEGGGGEHDLKLPQHRVHLR